MAYVQQPTLSQLGTAIRSLREERKLTVEGLAHETGLHRYSIFRIETGEQNVSWTVLTGIASALGIEILELVRLAGEQAPE